MALATVCLHPYLEYVGVVVDNRDALQRVIDALPKDKWTKFEGEFGFDGCNVPAEDLAYYPVRKRLTMTPEAYVNFVLDYIEGGRKQG